MPQIRVVAYCIFRHGSGILVAPGHDEVTDRRFYRPLGGGVEFGERAVDAVRREILEELGLETRGLELLGVLENLFVYRGNHGHEVAFVFDGQFTRSGVYDQTSIPITESGWSGPAEWIDLRAPLDRPLYPEGLADLIRSAPARLT